MSDRQITIAVDAMGGENTPYKTIAGTELFLKKNSNVKVVFFGDQNKIDKKEECNWIVFWSIEREEKNQFFDLFF